VSNLAEILDYLEGPLGLTPAQADGVAGNLVVESSLDPGAVNAAEGAHGIAQWENGRYTALQQFAAANGSQWSDLTTQLQFLGAELHGPESGALARLRQTSDPGQAAAVFDQYYERSSGSSRGKRVANAQKIAAGQDPTGGGSSSSSSDTSGGSSSGGSSGTSVAGSMGGLTGSIFTIALKTLGAAAAAGLVIVGAVHTVSN